MEEALNLSSDRLLVYDAVSVQNRNIFAFGCMCLKISLWACLNFLFQYEGRHSVDGTATCAGLGGPGIESRCSLGFPYASKPAVGPTSLLYNGHQAFPGVKAA